MKRGDFLRNIALIAISPNVIASANPAKPEIPIEEQKPKPKTEQPKRMTVYIYG